MTQLRLDGTDENSMELGLLLQECAPANPNPMVVAYGKLEPTRRCKECRFLEKHSAGNTWYKCAFRRKGGPATDHRVGWDACGKFEAAA